MWGGSLSANAARAHTCLSFENSRALVHHTTRERLLERTATRAEHQQRWIALDPDRIQTVPGLLGPLHGKGRDPRHGTCQPCHENHIAHRPYHEPLERMSEGILTAPTPSGPRHVTSTLWDLTDPKTALGAGKSATTVAAVLATRLTNLWWPATAATSDLPGHAALPLCDLVSSLVAQYLAH